MCDSCNNQKKNEKKLDKTCYTFQGKKVCEVCGCHDDRCTCDTVEE